MRLVVPLFFFIPLLVVSSAVHAQKAESIALFKNQLVEAREDTARARLSLKLSQEYYGIQVDSSMEYAMRARDISRSINDVKGQADAILQLGRIMRDQNERGEALNHMFEALALYRQIRDSVQIAHSLNDISIVYANSQDYQYALEYFNQALDIFKKRRDTKGESYALNNIGIIYQDMGDEASAKKYFLESLAIKIRINDIRGIYRGYSNLGSIAEHENDFATAMLYYKKADSLITISMDKRAQAINYLAMARIKNALGKQREARRLGEQARLSAEEIRDLSITLRATLFLAELEEETGNFQAALEYQKLCNALSDSINARNHRANLEELKAKFNIDEKEHEISLLKMDQQLQKITARNSQLVSYGLMVALFLFLGISIATYYAYRTTKAARDRLAHNNKEIEQQRNELDRLNNEKDRFFSILSHDLRAPVHSLKGLSNLQLRHSHVLNEDESTKIKVKIDSSIDHLTTLIDNILEWSMTTSKKRKWTFDHFNVGHIVNKNLELYQNIAESKDVKLLYRYLDDISGYADQQAIDTVIRNLISNAIKFSHPGGTVEITVTQQKEMILIMVRDEGIGMTPQVQQSLFSHERSVKQKGTNNEGGSGIGLILCKELMKENNGEIRVKSSPGQGSEFIVSFPASAVQVAHTATVTS